MEVNKMNPMHLFPKIPGKAVVVFSGGQDSTTCLYWALRVFDEVEAVTFFYQQRHHLEAVSYTHLDVYKRQGLHTSAQWFVRFAHRAVGAYNRLRDYYTIFAIKHQ